MMVMIVAIGSTKYSYVSPLLKLSPIATKGLSLIATDDIKKGTLLIEEEALFQLKTFNIRMTEDMEIDRITKKVECLSSKEYDDFYSLHAYSKSTSINEYTRALFIFRTNAYPTTINTAGIFPTISRINSECSPNVHYHYNQETKRSTIYAINDIDKNTEILNCYIGILPRHERQSYLLEHFGFVCNCKICMKSDNDLVESDQRRIDFMKLEIQTQDLINSEHGYDKKEAMKLVNKRFKLLEDENINTSQNLLKVEYDAFKITKELQWYERYSYSWHLCKGSSKKDI